MRPLGISRGRLWIILENIFNVRHAMRLDWINLAENTDQWDRLLWTR
jgi:hypothetical protein